VTRTLPESFDAALDAWADKVAAQFEQHGVPEQHKPEDWFDDGLLELLTDDESVMDVLFVLACEKFRAACAKRGHK
jgi:hypothetical protein